MGKTETLWKSSVSVQRRKLVLISLPVKEEPRYSWRSISQGRDGTKPLEGQEGAPAELWESQAGEKKKKKHWKMSFLSKLAPSPTGRAGKTNTKPRRIPEGASAPHIPLEIPQNLAWDQQLCPDPVIQQGAQSFPGKAGQEWEQPQLSKMGIPSWKRGVRRTESGIKKITRFGMFFHPGMMRGFRR